MISYGRWDVELPGESHVWEPDEVSLGEQRMLEVESGQRYDDWIRACGQGRADACQILVWFLRRKSGVQIERNAVDFPIRKLEITEVEVSPDPEAPAGSEPATGSPSSSGGVSTPPSSSS